MSDSSVFNNFGLLAFPHFFSPEECESLCDYATVADVQPTQVGDPTGVRRDATHRKGLFTYLDSGEETLVCDRLKALVPRLNRHYSVSLSQCNRPRLLVYGEGDFFHTHSDRGGDGAPAEVRDRQVSAVMFLDSADSFGGGELTFHRWDRDSDEALSEVVSAEPGLMVTFLSDVLHEVTPVSWGVRRTIVTWFR